MEKTETGHIRQKTENIAFLNKKLPDTLGFRVVYKLIGPFFSNHM